MLLLAARRAVPPILAPGALEQRLISVAVGGRALTAQVGLVDLAAQLLHDDRVDGVCSLWTEHTAWTTHNVHHLEATGAR